MRKPHAWSRRDWLLGSLGLAPLAMARAAAQTPVPASAQASPQGAAQTAPHETHYRVPPTARAAAAADGGAAAAQEAEEALRARLARPVTRLAGADPMAALTQFEYGRVSRLADGRTLREVEIVAEDREIEVAPGLFFPAWTYGGRVPGPTIRCTQGDRLRVRFVNRSLADHTMHFHGIHAANMDGSAEIVRPGESYVYEFDAEPYGLQLYHCHVPPVDLHINRGMYGAFIIDPPRPRPPARELVLVSAGYDLDFDGRNEIYVLNGVANFYRDHPIALAAGEPVRLYFVNALEFEAANSLHLHGNFFTCWHRTPAGETPEYTDIVTCGQADRRILEFTFRHTGTFMFHAHQNRFAERGAMGHFRVA